MTERDATTTVISTEVRTTDSTPFRAVIAAHMLSGKTTLASGPFQTDVRQAAKPGVPVYDVDDAQWDKSSFIGKYVKELRAEARATGDWTEHNRLWYRRINAWSRTLPGRAIILGHHPENAENVEGGVLTGIVLIPRPEFEERLLRVADSDPRRAALAPSNYSSIETALRLPRWITTPVFQTVAEAVAHANALFSIPAVPTAKLDKEGAHE